ncbi:hypothetical protein BCR41DRAFT_386023 [Lobosporangium transversale]|eukprot:XP_021875635.1 hypothetical protein BCR41DRAFT_426681 [Lobosporangium transversale]
MGVGKSYISWFLAAKAYAHDTLTASELEEMVEIETSENLFVSSASSILGDLLQSRSQKALFVVDEHGALFPEK